MTRTNSGCAALAVLVALGHGTAWGSDLFKLDLTVTTPSAATGSAAFNSITTLADQFSTQNLNSLAGTYTQTSAASATVNFRGLLSTVSYPANSTALRFVVPGASIDVTFTGATRADSEQQFRDFLLKNGGGLATKFLQALVATSPIDPVAGNPTSLQSSSARSDFQIGTGIGIPSDLPDPPSGASAGPRFQPSVATLRGNFGSTRHGGEYTSAIVTSPGGGSPGGGALGVPNLATAGGDIGIARSGGYTSAIISLPIRYVLPFKDPRYAVTFDLPLTYVKTGDASSYFGSFGVALRIPVLENWYLTPNIRIGGVGSVDLGAAAIQYSGGLASRYDVFFDDLRLTIGNAVSVVRTGGFSLGPISVNYDLTNALITNGAQLEGSLPYAVFGQPTSWQAFVTDTVVTGSKVYINHYNEIGVTVGTRHGMNTQAWDSLRIGAGATVAARYNAFKLIASYRF